jgi:hypothetical protein
MMEAADKGRLNDSAQVGTVHRSPAPAPLSPVTCS